MNSSSHWSEQLVKAGVHSEAIEWAKQQPSFQEAWNKCTRSDLLLTLLSKSNMVSNDWRHLACLFAKDTLQNIEHKDIKQVCENTLTIVEKFILGEASVEELYKVHSASYHAGFHKSFVNATKKNTDTCYNILCGGSYAVFAISHSARYDMNYRVALHIIYSAMFSMINSKLYTNSTEAEIRQKIMAAQANMIRATINFERVESILQ